MKDLILYNKAYRKLEEGFKEWLALLEHHHTTIDGAPVRIREFLHWLEDNSIESVLQITGTLLEDYIAYLSHRKNHRRQGGLSANYLNKHIVTLKQFSEYLQQSREQGFTVALPYYDKRISHRDILTRQEIKTLYEATTPDVFGLRDRAILGIYYGCGLRRSEGVGLDVNDLLLQKRLLYVRKGKNYSERYVPVTASVFNDLIAYLQLGRSCFESDSPALLLSYRHKKRLTASVPYKRVSELKERAGINKQIGLHTLRHSIATHLLQQGMKLADISRFLGHQSIDSTQIYTHILQETYE